MSIPIPSGREKPPWDATLKNLAQLFARMDAAYEQAAAAHGFVCRGCDDNCCRTLFYHHTLVEYLYLRRGLAALPDDRRAAVEAQAAQTVASGEGVPADQRMCPLNEQGRCLLYAHRPMICRLHGIPHRLQRPDGRCQTGPGCGDFDRQCGAVATPLLDRTPLYTAMAALERELRRQTGFQERLRMTIAQMIVQQPMLPGQEGASS